MTPTPAASTLLPQRRVFRLGLLLDGDGTRMRRKRLSASDTSARHYGTAHRDFPGETANEWVDDGATCPLDHRPRHPFVLRVVVDLACLVRID